VTFDEIEQVLGGDVVGVVQAAIGAAYVTASSRMVHGDGQLALENLLIALLASVIAVSSRREQAVSRSLACARHLEDLVAATLAISTETATGTTAPRRSKPTLKRRAERRQLPAKTRSCAGH